MALPEEKYYELVRYDRAKFRYCYEMLHGYLNADWCGILDVDMEIGVWTPIWWYDREFGEMAQTKFEEFELSKKYGRWIQCLRDHEPIIVPDVEAIKEEMPDEYILYRRLDANAVMAVPFWKGLTGFLALRNAKKYKNQTGFLRMLNYAVISSLNEYFLLETRKLTIISPRITNTTDVYNGYTGTQFERPAGNIVSLKRTLKGIYGKDTPIDKEDWVRVENTHEAIVSYEDFLRTQETFKVYQKGQPKEIDRTNAFECAHCGRKLSYSRDRKKLICRYGEVNPQAVCGNAAYSDVKLRETVMTALQWHFEQFLHWEQLRKVQQEKEEADLDTSLYERTISNLEKKKTRLYEKYREGDLTREEYMTQRNEVNSEVRELQNKVQTIEAKRMMQKNGNARVDLLSKLVHQYKDARTLTKELERVFVEQVLVYDAEHIKIKWKFDDVFAALMGNG